MHLITIKPLDSLFLGTHKGFNTIKELDSEEDSEEKMRNNWYPTDFIPLPSVFYGCISTLYLKHNIEIFNKYKREKDNKREENKKYVKLGRMSLDIGGNRCVTLPTHFCTSQSNKLLNMEYVSNQNYFNELKDDNQRYVRLSELYDYYRNSARVIQTLYDVDEIFKKSYTVSLSTKNKMAVDNKLYRKDIVNPVTEKFNGYSIEFFIEEEDKNNSVEDKGFLLFGGEKKLCEYSIIRNFTPEYNYQKKEMFKTEWVRVVTFSPMKINKKIIDDFAHSNIFCKNSKQFMITKKANILHSFYLKEKQEILQAGTVMYIKDEHYKTMNYEEVYLHIYNKYFREFYNDKDYKNFSHLDTYKDGFNVFDIFEYTLEDK